MVVVHPISGDQLVLGLDLVTVTSLKAALENVETSGCDFVVCPLVHPRYERAPLHQDDQSPGDLAMKPPWIDRDDPLTRSGMELRSGQWIEGVVGKLSPWIRPDSASARTRRLSEDAFREEYELASHLSLKAVITPRISSSDDCVNLANCISSALSLERPTGIWVRVPISFGTGDPELCAEPASEISPWEVWNKIRTLCNSHRSLGVVLEMESELVGKRATERWYAEPVEMISIPTSTFVKNKAGFPVLLKRHKDFVTNMFQSKVPFAVSGNAATTNSSEGAKPYVMFLAHLFGKQPVDGHDADDDAYLDYLQSPLQPLADNLEGSMYETFESDPVKYARYQEAVRLYLSRKIVERLVIMVLGAGRGPLVAACLAAAEQTQRNVFIYAVEKNASAVITLRNRRDREPWKQRVKVVQADMRSWKPPEKADLIVSELLGSFGDNELSPECLSSAHKLLARDGICIPQNSTSFIAPICSQALHSNVAALGPSRAHFETPYVVKIQHGVRISGPQPCFKFAHPNDRESHDFSRYAQLSFDVEEDYMLHGFVGYFDAMLYGGIDLSILPEMHTPKMFSWYSIYFPIMRPLLLKKGEALDFHMWRRSSAKKVWYEWTVTSPTPIAIHNVNGRSYGMDVLPMS